MKAGISDNDNDEDVKTVIEGDETANKNGEPSRQDHQLPSVIALTAGTIKGNNEKDPLKRNVTEAGVGEGESNTPPRKKGGGRQAKNKPGKS